MARNRHAGNGHSPEELEREIEHTRHEIENTLEELGERLSPGQLLDQSLSYLRESGAAEGSKAFVTNFGRSVRDNPLAVTMAAAGLAWLMSGNRESHRYAGDSGSVSGLGTSGRWREGVGEATSDIARRAKETGSQIQRTQADLRAGARRQAERARGAWSQARNEQPLMLGLAGMALGALLGGILPSTESEDELMGEARDETLASAAEKGRQTAEEVRRKAEETRQSTETSRRDPFA